MFRIRTKLRRIVCILTAMFACLLPSTTAHAFYPLQSYRATNQAIKSLPIMVRPNRPGHFYGNSVRRVFYRTNGRVNIEQMRPKVFIGEL